MVIKLNNPSIKDYANRQYPGETVSGKQPGMNRLFSGSGYLSGKTTLFV